MSAKHLALIGTPGHYFNLLECVEQTGIQKKDIVLILFNFTSDKSTNAFFDHSIDQDEWKKVKKIAIWETSTQSIFTAYNLIRLTNYFIGVLRWVLWQRFDAVIVNQIDVAYYRIFYNLCKFERMISMDEGNAIMKFIEQRNHSKGNSGRFPLPEEIIFFSSYDIEVKASDQLITCTYEYSKRILQIKETDEKLVLFIGSPFVEDNMMDQEIFMEYLQKVSLHYTGFQVVYISHRREAPENLSKIRERFHFSTVRLEEPVELYFLQMEKVPQVISGFYSAAVFNLKKMTPQDIVSFESYYVDPKDIRKDTPELVGSIYDQFANAGIEIIG